MRFAARLNLLATLSSCFARLPDPDPSSGGLDALPVRVRVLGDVGVRRDDRLRHAAPPPYTGSRTRGRLVTPRKTMLGGIGSGVSSTRRKRRVRSSSTRSATSASRVASDAPRQ